ncbi:hypothetical protein C7C46_02485 [Streptomyces tateyamensis]|uniref:Uncharacterized protein n=1 Tax=Streptomyces tateyamensis TaxID=565073 RepID=A0A2V4NMX3_9ACTN|nr:hypothetical protein C7C46_02485 [Streptomyces tateyamensis]
MPRPAPRPRRAARPARAPPPPARPRVPPRPRAPPRPAPRRTDAVPLGGVRAPERGEGPHPVSGGAALRS